MNPALIVLFVFLFVCAIGGFIAYLVKLSYEKERHDREDRAADQKKRDDAIAAQQNAAAELLDDPKHWEKKLIAAKILVLESEQNIQRISRGKSPSPAPP